MRTAMKFVSYIFMIVLLAGIFCPLLVGNLKDNSNENWVAAESSNGGVGVNPSSSLASAQTESVYWWPMFHHDLTHTGSSTSTAPKTNQTLWNYTTDGGVSSSPAVVEGKVFVGSNDQNFYALDAVTGTQVWNFTTGGSVSSSPAVACGVVYVGSLNMGIYAIGARWQVNVYWSRQTEPAPMGIADYGIGPSGPYEYSTKSFVGIATVASLLTNMSSNYIVSLQLNIEFEFNTTCGLRVFWMQNCATINAYGSVLRLENFGSNIWNWSEPSAIMSRSGISGGGSFGTPQDPYGYVCTRNGNYTPFNLTAPMTITLNVTSGLSSSGEPTASFAYDFGDGPVTYDTVTFTNVTATSTPVFEVNGFQYAPSDAFYDAELIFGGFLRTTDVLSDV